MYLFLDVDSCELHILEIVETTVGFTINFVSKQALNKQTKRHNPGKNSISSVSSYSSQTLIWTQLIIPSNSSFSIRFGE